MKVNENSLPPVYFFKLKTNEDIVAESIEVDDETGHYYTVYNPIKVVYVPAPGSGALQVVFMPWIFGKICNNQEFVIQAGDVILTSLVSEYMSKYYWNNVDDFFDEEIDDSLGAPKAKKAHDNQIVVTKRELTNEELQQLITDIQTGKVSKSFH